MPWCTVQDVLLRVPAADTTTATRAADYATEVLDELTGGRYRQRTLRLRHDHQGQGHYFRTAVDTWPHDWSLRLPADTTAVTQVTVDGLAVDPAEYRLEPGGRLVRVDGRAWPTDTQVTAVAGRLPTSGAVSSCLTLAVEVAKAWKDSPSRLPRRMTEVRGPDGSTLGIVNSLDVITRGGTGIPEVDAWLAAEGVFSDRRLTGAALSSPGRHARTARIQGVIS